MKRILVSADVHGTHDELLELLKLAKYDKNDDFLIFVGDALNRGPKSIETFQYLKNTANIYIPGNHEIVHTKIYDYKKSGLEIPFRVSSDRLVINQQLLDSDIEWLKNQPLYYKLNIEDEDWLFVHGGFLPYLNYENNKPHIYTTLRYVDSSGNPTRIEKNKKAKHWTDLWEQDYNVVYGHHIHSKDKPRTVINRNNKVCIGIDTGAVFGGNLTLLELPSRNIYQVKCRQYYK